MVKVKSLKKALDVLGCFSIDRPELGVTEIADMLGIHKATVFNILSTFAADSFVVQDQATKKYKLGTEILRLSHVVREGLEVRSVALPVMEKAKERFGETVHLAIEKDGHVVYIESVQPTHYSVGRLATGKRAPLYCTGIGKAMLAFLSESVLMKVEKAGLARYTDNTITDVDLLKKELEKVRRRGYAIDDMEHEWGIRCIGVPIRNESDEVFAAMSMTGPSIRFEEDRVNEMAYMMIQWGFEISRRLGWDPTESAGQSPSGNH